MWWISGFPKRFTIEANGSGFLKADVSSFKLYIFPKIHFKKFFTSYLSLRDSEGFFLATTLCNRYLFDHHNLPFCKPLRDLFLYADAFWFVKGNATHTALQLLAEVLGTILKRCSKKLLNQHFSLLLLAA